MSINRKAELVDDSSSQTPAWIDSPWLYAALAGACLAAVWVPIVVSIVEPVYAFDYWGVLSGYLGVAWLAPAVFVGIAASRLARQRGVEHPKPLAVVVGVVSGALFISALATWMAATEARWVEETSAVTPSPTEPDPPQPSSVSPRDLVLARVGTSRQVIEVLCARGLGELRFCVVSFEGPACQLWSIDDEGAEPLFDVVRGAYGSRSDNGVHCGI